VVFPRWDVPRTGFTVCRIVLATLSFWVNRQVKQRCQTALLVKATVYVCLAV
jgi:hypothetical protein